MSKPTVLAVSQIEAAAKAAVEAAITERTVALSNDEARSTSGGAIGSDPFKLIVMGYFPTEPTTDPLAF